MADNKENYANEKQKTQLYHPGKTKVVREENVTTVPFMVHL